VVAAGYQNQKLWHVPLGICGNWRKINMLITSTSTLELVTTTTALLHYYVEYVDYIPGTSFSPSASQGTIAAATTTTMLASPAAGTTRKIKSIIIRNTSATESNTVTVQRDVSTVNYSLTPDTSLQPDETLVMDAADQWQVMDGNGRIKTVTLDQDPINGVSQCFRKVGTAPEAAGIGYFYGKDSGYPGAWLPGTPGLNGRATNGTTAADAGCIPIPTTTGSNWLTQINGSSTVAGDMSFIDLVWVNSGIVVTTTTAQAITSVAFPARDLNGSSNGVGYCVAIYVSVATTNAAAITNTTLNYTNELGVAGRTATIASFPATAVAGTWVPFQLATGDMGIRSIQGITLGTSYGAGTIHIAVYKQYPGIDNIVPNLGATNTLPGLGARLYTGVALLPLNRAASAATATTTHGSVLITQRV